MDISIRRAMDDDEPAIRACAEVAYGRYVALIGRRPAPMDSDIASHIKAGDVYVAVARDHSLVGYIVFFPKDGHMVLDAIGVQPFAAGRGVGKALIRFCEDHARRDGLGDVRLYTNEKMTDNLSIYPHLGYVEVGRRFDDGFHRVFFEKKLA